MSIVFSLDESFGKVAYNVQGLLPRWNPMFLQPERHMTSEPKAEDMYKR